ncbi:thiamine-phosphate kinase [Cellvibrio japonicus]|nr:thiamine-phosphate kinase [Cellvibrio japonicus]QEI14231.1 thiamine-phosphate kinase [Cellvibrio japonicus]QEI17808.1 thiamine-phosphate kinase [Cellvibrio japonicus]QEI21383.1 thiamine-phosphate kinase [Cellvibrio japonicus]
MVPGEFQLIQQFFQREQAEQPAAGVVLGIGDDCALLQIPEGKQLAVSVDTLVSGVHFPEGAEPALIAERALRTNLSDLAAMGAEPLWFTLALTLPQAEEQWLREFSRGLFACAKRYGIALIGGDTTAGPLSVSIQVMGAVTPGQALRRDGANLGDFILVTHSVGDGAAALASLQGRVSFSGDDHAYLHERFYRPEPRLQASARIRPFASAALDISDGLVADLQHICTASDLGAVIDVEALPLSSALVAYPDRTQAYEWALSGGDDYELCFTVAPENMPDIAMLIAQGQLQASVIGEMVAGNRVICEYEGQPFSLAKQGYEHF